VFVDLRDDAQSTAAAFRRLFTGQFLVLLPRAGTLLVLAPC
jgi:hypothetical protein